MRTARATAMFVAVVLAVAACGGGTATLERVVETVSAQRASEIIEESPAGLIVLDVRTPEEFAQARLAGAVNLDYYAADFGDELAALDPEADYVLYCRTGNRSGTTREMMRELGFDSVHEIGGGIVAWYEAGLPVVP